MPVYNDQYIDDYLLDRLKIEERMDFEETLSSNKALQQKVELRRNIIKGTKSLGRDIMKERLKIIHSKLNKPPTVQRSIWTYLSGITAAIALIVIAWSYLSSNNNMSTEELFAANYHPYNLNLVSRDASAPDLVQLNELYKNKKYKTALPLFKKMILENPEDTRIILGAGIILLELNQPENARSYFLRILKAQDIRLSDSANWYISMSYLKEGKLVETRNALEALAGNPKADWHKEALNLISRIDRCLPQSKIQSIELKD